jgi:hypothetical protein
MKKQLTEKTVYQPNTRVKVTVQNKPEFDEDTQVTRYERKVTIVVDMGASNDKIMFGTDEDIADFLANVDVEDPQLSLLEDGPEDESENQ